MNCHVVHSTALLVKQILKRSMIEVSDIIDTNTIIYSNLFCLAVNIKGNNLELFTC